MTHLNSVSQPERENCSWTCIQSCRSFIVLCLQQFWSNQTQFERLAY